MFIGHFAVALAAKRAVPEVSLGTLFLAAQLADLVWPTLVLLGLERFEIRPGITAVTPLDFVHYPYSHSLVALAGWAFALGFLYYAFRRGGRGAAILFATSAPTPSSVSMGSRPKMFVMTVMSSGRTRFTAPSSACSTRS